MPRSTEIALLEQFADRLNQGDLESIRQTIARDFFAHVPEDDEPTATEVFYEILSDVKRAVSDFAVEVHELRIDGDVIRGQVTLRGTHDGPLWDAPASGVRVVWPVALAARPIDGKFAITLENMSGPAVRWPLQQMELVDPTDQLHLPLKYPVRLPEVIWRMMFFGQMADKPCTHLDGIQITEPTTDVCRQCVATGDIWPALRMCLTCGFVGCCDTSKNKHVKQHFEQTGHPLYRSIRMDESWMWCYADNAFFSGRLLDKHRKG